jgi:alanine racemase
MQLPLADFNLTRAGIAVYGLPPSTYLAGKVALQPAMSLHAEVVSIRRLPAGSSISYGARYSTSKESSIAVLPLGYADGYTRRMSHQAYVLIHGHRFPVVGTICMDQCMVDLGDFPAEIGDEAVLLGTQLGESISADELADWSKTINYEIVCGISDRVPRLYTHS